MKKKITFKSSADFQGYSYSIVVDIECQDKKQSESEKKQNFSVWLNEKPCSDKDGLFQIHSDFSRSTIGQRASLISIHIVRPQIENHWGTFTSQKKLLKYALNEISNIFTGIVSPYNFFDPYSSLSGEANSLLRYKEKEANVIVSEYGIGEIEFHRGGVKLLIQEREEPGLDVFFTPNSFVKRTPEWYKKLMQCNNIQEQRFFYKKFRTPNRCVFQDMAIQGITYAYEQYVKEFPEKKKRGLWVNVIDIPVFSGTQPEMALLAASKAFFQAVDFEHSQTVYFDKETECIIAPGYRKTIPAPSGFALELISNYPYPEKENPYIGWTYDQFLQCKPRLLTKDKKIKRYLLEVISAITKELAVYHKIEKDNSGFRLGN